MKKILCFLIPFLFWACDDDLDNPSPSGASTNCVAYVINQGNFYDGITGSLDAFTADGKYLRDVFATQNQGMRLGDTPQDGVIYGTKLYVAVYESNLLWVIDKKTAKVVKRLEINAPENVCAAYGKVFLTTNDGYLNALDTLSLNFENRVAVGPNPMGCAVKGNEVFVAVSDGYNYDNGYVNGKKVSVVDALGMTVKREIPVGLNPTQVVATKDAVYVVCSGNYADVLPEVWRIADGVAEKYADGTHIATNGEKLVVMNMKTDWATYITTITYSIDLKGDAPPSPVSISVSPEGRLFVATDAKLNDYSSSGAVFEYDENGNFLNKHEAGCHPFKVVFDAGL